MSEHEQFVCKSSVLKMLEDLHQKIETDKIEIIDAVTIYPSIRDVWRTETGTGILYDSNYNETVIRWKPEKRANDCCQDCRCTDGED